MLESALLDRLKEGIFDYKFHAIEDKNAKFKVKDDGIKDYSFAPLEGREEDKFENAMPRIQAEREIAAVNAFKISPIVLEHRNINQLEQVERTADVKRQVDKAVARLTEEATTRGYEEGVRLGREEVYNQTRVFAEEKLEVLGGMINDVLKKQNDLLHNQKQETYKLIKNLTKWIILRELKDDGKYVERLLEKLIVELREKNNLLIQVNQNDFDKMPEVIEAMNVKLGNLTNVRLEIDYDITEKGIVVEGENGIIVGTLDQQFKALDRLFETVGIYE